MHTTETVRICQEKRDRYQKKATTCAFAYIVEAAPATTVDKLKEASNTANEDDNDDIKEKKKMLKQKVIQLNLLIGMIKKMKQMTKIIVMLTQNTTKAKLKMHLREHLLE